MAAALLGDLEPAGRLVTTFPVEDGAAPAWSVTPVDGDLVYSKLKTGEFPDEKWVLNTVGDRLKK